jgi:hypothetical protein
MFASMFISFWFLESKAIPKVDMESFGTLGYEE